MGTISLKAFRNRFGLPVPDDKIDEIPYLKLEEGSPEYNYMRARQQAMGGFIHHRRRKAAALQIPPLSALRHCSKPVVKGVNPPLRWRL